LCFVYLYSVCVYKSYVNVVCYFLWTHTILQHKVTIMFILNLIQKITRIEKEGEKEFGKTQSLLKRMSKRFLDKNIFTLNFISLNTRYLIYKYNLSFEIICDIPCVQSLKIYI